MIVHEASIAQNIIDIAIKIASEHKARKVNKIVIVVGELNFLDLDALKFAFQVLSEKTMLESAELIIELKPAKFKCLKCGSEWSASLAELKDKVELHFTPELVLNFLECPNCKSYEVEIEGGRELYIKDIELVV